MKKRFILFAAMISMFVTACGQQAGQAPATDSAGQENSAEASESAGAAEEEAAIQIPENPDLDVWNISSEELPQLNGPQAGDYIATMQTTMGDIKIALFPEHAPKTVENFVTHARDGYYDGVIFHRVVNDFMIQGGDPEGTGSGGESIFGEAFEDEFSPYLYNIRGAISMANAGPNTNGSQFFIVQAKPFDTLSQLMGMLKADHKDQNAWAYLLAPTEVGGFGFTGYGFPDVIMDYYIENGGTPNLDTHHTAFGQVIEGMDIVDAIAAVEVIANPQDPREQPEISYPKEKVIINSILIEEVK